MQFRADIEGLRAVAIVPIVLLHAAFQRVPGGFAGVDIFFVISGYLITGIVARDIAAGRFSPAAFYQRRAARILPALLVMLLAVLAAGSLLLVAADVDRLARATIAAAAFAANFHYYAVADYFAHEQVELLLHTWSLGVEEQFYLLYPLLLLALGKWIPRYRVAALAAVALVSFALSCWLAAAAPQAGFYLLPGRIWELALGGLIALKPPPAADRPIPAAILAIAGLLLIAGSVLLMRPDLAFPGPWALVPSLGAAMLIAYGTGGPTALLLSLPPVRWVGRISYSVYLWHWPIVAFYQLEYDVPASNGVRFALVLAAIAAGAVSYWLVERPALARFRRMRAWIVFTGAAAGIAAVVGASLLAMVAAAHRPASEATRIAAYLEYKKTAEFGYQFRRGSCFREDGIDFGRCVTLSAAKPNVIVIGDSYAAHIWRAVAERFPDLNVLQATTTKCKPIWQTQAGDAVCRRAFARVLGPIAASGRLAGIVLAARWNPDEAEGLRRTVAMLRAHGVAVTVIGPPVEYRGDYPRILATAIAHRDPNGTDRWRRSERDGLDTLLRPVVDAAGGQYLGQISLECPRGSCRRLTVDGTPYHFDPGHLTLSAAREFAAHLHDPAMPR